MNQSKDIFKKASKTFYYSSIFFPKKTKQAIFDLYAFVRVADDFVDEEVQKAEKLDAYKEYYLTGHTIGLAVDEITVVDNFKIIEKEYNFEQKWTLSFLESMKMDLSDVKYTTEKQLWEYIYGSAEVIGLYICRICGLKENSYEPAMELGKAFQIINMIRDIGEDVFDRGRYYLPLMTGENEFIASDAIINNLDKLEDKKFENYIKYWCRQYLKIQKDAQKGFKLIPYRQRVPIMTASDRYAWTAKKIMNNPKIVLTEQVKPSKWQVIASFLSNSITALFI